MSRAEPCAGDRVEKNARDTRRTLSAWASSYSERGDVLISRERERQDSISLLCRALASYMWDPRTWRSFDYHQWGTVGKFRGVYPGGKHCHYNLQRQSLQSLGRRHSTLLPNKVLESMEGADMQELPRERLGANGALNNKLLENGPHVSGWRQNRYSVHPCDK